MRETLASQRLWITASRGAACILPKTLLGALMTTYGTALLAGQAIPAASTSGDLLVGAGYVRANPDYSPQTFQGVAIFAVADLWTNFGVEANVNHISNSSPGTITETTYEAGVRSRVQVGRLVPFAGIVTGLGSFTYLRSSQNGTYGLYAGNGGVEYVLSQKLLFRAKYEYQRWSNFPPRGLQPNLVSVGFAYRIR